MEVTTDTAYYIRPIIPENVLVRSPVPDFSIIRSVSWYRMSSSSDYSEKNENGPTQAHAVDAQDVDVAAHVAVDTVVKPLTPEEAQRLR